MEKKKVSSLPFWITIISIVGGIGFNMLGITLLGWAFTVLAVYLVFFKYND